MLRVLSTPRYDAEQLECNDDIMRFDTVVYCCEWAGRLQNYGPDLVLPRVDRMNQGKVDKEEQPGQQSPCNLVDVVSVRVPVCA